MYKITKKIKKTFLSQQFIKFLLAGGFAAVINFLARILINKILIFEISIVIAYIIGMITAFTLNKTFVFKKSQKPWTKEFLYFTLVNIIAMIQMFIISLLLYRFILPFFSIKSHSREIAHGIGIIIPVFTSFIGHKYLSFRKIEFNKN